MTRFIPAGIIVVSVWGLAGAACDCELTGADPCTGTTISETVTGDGRSIAFDWAFHSGGGPARCGRFANGDYWVAPAAGEASVTVTAVAGSGSGDIYVDADPRIEAMGLLSRDYGNLDTSENIVPRLPLTYDHAVSLVAVIQRDEARFGNCGTNAIVGCCAEAYHVVTILDSVPPGNGVDILRPAITEPRKELLSGDDFDLTRLPAFDYLEGTDSAGLEAVRSVWSHHIEVLAMRDTAGAGYSEGGRAFRADLVTDDYAATVAQAWHNHLMYLLSGDHTVDEMKPALAAMLTYGKDIYSHVYAPDGTRERWFGVGAGQSLGRFPAAVFFAALAVDPRYGEALSRASSTQVNLGGSSVHELDQVNLGHNGPVWGDHDDFENKYDVGRYWGEMLKVQTFEGASGDFPSVVGGKKTYRDPYGYIDGPGIGPGSAYMGVTAGPIIAFAAEMCMMPEVCDIVNYPALVVYANRIVTEGIKAGNDPCAPPDPRENPETCDCYRATGCEYYGLSNTGEATWGPDPVAVAAGDWYTCIRNGTDPITGLPQNGRFTSRDGAAASIGYTVRQALDNWATIYANRGGCGTDSSGVKPTPRAGSKQPPIARARVDQMTGSLVFAPSGGAYRVFDLTGSLVMEVSQGRVNVPTGTYLIGRPGLIPVRVTIVR
ncbi:MAG: hypothetical protein GF331_17990 [Chitinivibrionales bacterium]|nr:hypothetical protein [Chitinivibrionales bacterium]